MQNQTIFILRMRHTLNGKSHWLKIAPWDAHPIEMSMMQDFSLTQKYLRICMGCTSHCYNVQSTGPQQWNKRSWLLGNWPTTTVYFVNLHHLAESTFKHLNYDLSQSTRWRRRRWLLFYGLLTNCAIVLLCVLFAILVNYFVHNVSATVSYGRK